MIQQLIDEYQEPLSISEKVRNHNYQQIQNDEKTLCKTQQLVYHCIANHPEGICDKQIRDEIGLPLSSICGRRNELMEIGLITAIDSRPYPDYNNRMRLNTFWGIL